MQRDDVVLYADGGDMTVGRRTAVYTYGNFQVIIPDDREQEEGDDRLQDGYISRPTERPTGRFDIGFVRADTTIDLNAGTSDLESVIDTAQKRTEGDIFFERDIYGRGLGRHRIGVDFDTDDVVQVQVWGKRIPLPVTTTEIIASENDGLEAQRVHVGGQLVADAEALRKHNDDLLQQISSEKQQRLKSVGEVRKTASTAKSTADEALSAVHDADGQFQSRLEETRRLIEEGREHAQAVAGHVAEAGRLAGDADRYAREAVAAADQADQILASIEGDAQDVRSALLQVSALHEQVKENVTLAQQAVTDGQDHVQEADRQATIAKGHAGTALDYAREAGLLVDEAEKLNESITGMVTQIEGMVDEGRNSAAAAEVAAQAAQRHVATAQEVVAQAQSILDSTGQAAESAQSALQDARDELALLDDVDGHGTSLTGLLARVVSLHQETLTAHDDTITKHGQVLSAHTEALQAVSDAASEASAAAADAGLAAEAALSAIEVQRSINETQKQINDLYARAIRAAVASSSQSGMAAMHAQMAAQEAKDAAQAALDAAATNTDSIAVLQEAQELLQTAVASNEDAIGKLRDANVKMDEAIRSASAAAESAGAAARSSGEAASEAGAAATSALEASATLEKTMEIERQAQQIVDKQQFNTLLLHDNQLKWSKWTRQRYIYAFSRESGVPGNVTINEIATGLIDARMNAVNGKGLEVTRRPGWAGNYKIEVSYTGGGDSNFQGRMGGRDTTATMELLAGDREIRWVAIWVWPEWSPEPREFIVRIDQNNDFSYDGEYDTWGTDSPIMNLGEGRIRLPTIDVTASVDVELFYGLQWITIPSGDIIGAGGYIRPVQDAEQRDTDLVTFTEFKGTLTWEPGAPQTGTQRMQVAQQTLSRHTWRTVASWTCPDWSAPVDASLKFELRFLEHNMISSNHYETRILLNGTQISSIQRNSLGGMNMYFAHDIDRQIKAGDRLEFQAQCGAGFSSERRVGGGEVLITW